MSDEFDETPEMVAYVALARAWGGTWHPDDSAESLVDAPPEGYTTDDVDRITDHLFRVCLLYGNDPYAVSMDVEDMLRVERGEEPLWGQEEGK